MGLADILGTADLHCRKVESTKWLKYKLRATIGGQQFEQTDGRSGFPFPLRSVGGRLEFITQILEDSPKLSSSGLAISMTNLIDSFIQQIFRLAQGSVLVQSVLNLMFRSGLVDTYRGLAKLPCLELCCNTTRYVSRVVKQDKKYFQHLTTFFMST